MRVGERSGWELELHHTDDRMRGLGSRDWKFIGLNGCGLPENGIIFVTAMAEKKLENDEVRYSAAYPKGAERL